MSISICSLHWLWIDLSRPGESEGHLDRSLPNFPWLLVCRLIRWVIGHSDIHCYSFTDLGMGSAAATTLDTLQLTLLFAKQGHCCGSIFPLARYKFFSRVWETWFGKNRMCSSTSNIECGVPCTINSYGLVVNIISTGLLHHYHHYIWIYLIVSSRKMLVHWQIAGLQNQYMGRISRLTTEMISIALFRCVHRWWITKKWCIPDETLTPILGIHEGSPICGPIKTGYFWYTFNSCWSLFPNHYPKLTIIDHYFVNQRQAFLNNQLNQLTNH